MKNFRLIIQLLFSYNLHCGDATVVVAVVAVCSVVVVVAGFGFIVVVVVGWAPWVVVVVVVVEVVVEVDFAALVVGGTKHASPSMIQVWHGSLKIKPSGQNRQGVAW